MFVSIAFVVVVLRVYVRTRLVKAFSWDDIWMVIAFVSSPHSSLIEIRDSDGYKLDVNDRIFHLRYHWSSLWYWPAYE